MTLPSAVIEVWDLIFAYTRLDLHHQGTGANLTMLFPEGARHCTYMPFKTSSPTPNSVTCSTRSVLKLTL